MRRVRPAHTLTGSVVLDEVVAVIGWDATVALAVAIGGTKLYVPLAFAAGSRVVAAIGAETAAKLSDHFHRTEMTIPSRFRDEATVRALAARRGLTPDDIALQARVHVRTVRRILARPIEPLLERGAASAQRQLALDLMPPAPARPGGDRSGDRRHLKNGGRAA